MIKIKIDQVKEICNLNKIKRDGLLESKFAIVDSLIKNITRRRFYKNVERTENIELNKSDLLHSAFYTGFSYLVYVECLEFLNTNTVGDGIIANTGLGDTRVELLDGEASYQRRNALEFQAYSVLLKYLNETGKKRYDELKLWDDMRRAGNSEAQRLIMNENSKNISRARLI